MCCRSQCKKRVPCIKTNVSPSRLFRISHSRAKRPPDTESLVEVSIDGGVPAAVGRAELLCQVDPGTAAPPRISTSPVPPHSGHSASSIAAACVKSAPDAPAMRPPAAQTLNRGTWRIASAGRRRGPTLRCTVVLDLALRLRIGFLARRLGCLAALPATFPRCASPPGAAPTPGRRPV